MRVQNELAQEISLKTGADIDLIKSIMSKNTPMTKDQIELIDLQMLKEK